MPTALHQLLRHFEADGLWEGDPSRLEPLEPAALPEPYRSLLDHTDDMTGTLEQHWGGEIGLRALTMRREDGVLRRRVVLVRGDEPVEYGAIRIHLDAFPERARALILAAHVPLGAILRRERIPHRCRTRGFFRVPPDATTRAGFCLEGEHLLYGRLAHLTGLAGRTMAEVIEILPPMSKQSP